MAIYCLSNLFFDMGLISFTGIVLTKIGYRVPSGALLTPSLYRVLKKRVGKQGTDGHTATRLYYNRKSN